jgi:hypothetical protein
MRTYATDDIHQIRGWLQAGPRAAVWALLECQVLGGVTGDVLEIGVFEGRTFGLLASSRRPGERLVAIDTFATDERRNAFIGNMGKIGLTQEHMKVCHMSSVDFALSEACVASEGRVRFLSLDGGHGHDDVANDLEISERVLSPEGIVAFDDFFNPWYPEVTAALFEHLAADPSLVPFAIAVNFGPPAAGANKLFLCRKEVAAQYREMLRGFLPKNLRKAREWQGTEVDVYDFEKGVFKLDPLLLIAPK